MDGKWYMGVECCICHRFMGTKEVSENPGKKVSHGICPKCLPKYHAEQMAEVEEMLKRMKKEENNV